MKKVYSPVACGCVYSTTLHILDIGAARLQFLSPLFISMDITKLGLVLQAMKFTGVCEIFMSVYGK